MERSDPVIERMLSMARVAAGRAYAPYSGFRVGAAVLAANGEVFAGCNVENASYSLAICAERNAIFHAVAAGHSKIVAVVIYAESGAPAPPCGACLQVMSELASDADVFSFSGTGEVMRSSVPVLLPHPFRLDGPSSPGD